MAPIAIVFTASAKHKRKAADLWGVTPEQKGYLKREKKGGGGGFISFGHTTLVFYLAQWPGEEEEEEGRASHAFVLEM